MNNALLYCVIHTEKQSDRHNTILNTWGKNQEIIFYSDHDDPLKHVYKVSNRNDYASGQEKQINIFSFLKHYFYSYEWYFFCDNDTFVNTNKVINDLSTFDPSRINCCSINHWPNDPSLFYPSGGAGFLIHQSIMSVLWNNTLTIYDNLEYGDVSLGLNSKRLNIQLNHNPLFNGMHPSFYGMSLNTDIKKFYTFHYIKDFQTMETMHDICN